MNQRPIDVLLELTHACASGELICVGDTELHVFLQEGRVAWATDSAQPFAFGRHLLEHTALTKETFQEVLESCRRDRLPIGETLIAWQVVTMEEIRAALEHQIRGALGALERCATGRTLFLERKRQFASYDARLTFPLDAVRAGRALDVGELVAALAAAIPEAAWFSVVARGKGLSGQELPEGLLERSIGDGASAVALRTGAATLLGATIGETDHSVWCRLAPEAAFGIVQTTMARVALAWKDMLPVEDEAAPSMSASGLRPMALREGTAAPIAVVGPELPEGDAIRAFMERAPEIVAAFVVEEGIATGAVRRGWEASTLTEVIRRRRQLLDVDVPADTSDSAEELGYRLRSVATAESQAWSFGAEIGTGRRRSVWMFMERSNAQGLGWAYLTSLGRQVEDAGGERLQQGWNKTG